jgi:hypothetical protein
MAEVVTYTVYDGVAVQFEIDPPDGYRPVGAGEVVGRVEEAVRPAVEAAHVVLDRIKALGPDEVEVKFGIKAGGSAGWLIAKAAAESSFEVTMTWKGGGARADDES